MNVNRDLWRRADLILDELLTLTPDERSAALDQKNLDPELEACVRNLLDADAVSNGLLDRPAEQLVGTGDGIGLNEFIGRRFGAFELEEKIGIGGMSVVFRAKRVESPFAHEVALKILTIAHIASSDRIQQEKEILARLRHANIATLIDGGVEPDGTSWLAMELVDGDSIGEYCKQAALDARQVVELFLQVCDAVTYAHQNLVVHRDIKPGNILVDAQGQVRLLDFGIAKLLGEADAEATLTRAFTPRYAAPEQFSGEAVTTATDVYGMGGVLYRLLCGTSPRKPTEGGGSTIASPPQHPSRTEKALAGIDRDLDTVVLKALRQEPARRYPSASQLRDDLVRWLARKPVEAMPSSLGYRFRKLVQRRFALAVSIVLLFLAVLMGTAGIWWQARLARNQAAVAVREAQRATAVTDFLVDLFLFADPDHSQGKTLTVPQVLDVGVRQLETRLQDQGEVRIELLSTVGEIYRRLGLYDEAEPLLDDAVALAQNLDVPTISTARLRRANLAMDRFELEAAEKDIKTLVDHQDVTVRTQALQAYGVLLRKQGKYKLALKAFEQALTAENQTDQSDSARLAAIRHNMADTAYFAGEFGKAGEIYTQALVEVRQAHGGNPHTQVAAVLHSLGVHSAKIGDMDAADRCLEEALEIRENLLGPLHPDVAYTLRPIAMAHRKNGRFDQAEKLYRRALDIQQSQFGETHPAVLSTLNSLAVLAYDRQEIQQGADILEEVVARSRLVYGDDHPKIAAYLVNLAAFCRLLKQVDRAETLLMEALAIIRVSKGEKSLDAGKTLGQLGNLARDRGHLEEAQHYYRQVLAIDLALTDETHPDTIGARINIGGVSFAQGHFADAVTEFKKALAAAESMPTQHPLRNLVAARLARSMLHLGDVEQALTHAQKAAEATGKLYPPDHPRRLEVEAVWGAALTANGSPQGHKVLREVQDRLEAGARSRAAGEIITVWFH